MFCVSLSLSILPYPPILDLFLLFQKAGSQDGPPAAVHTFFGSILVIFQSCSRFSSTPPKLVELKVTHAGETMEAGQQRVSEFFFSVGAGDGKRTKAPF